MVELRVDMGRPIKLNEDKMQQICKWLTAGHFIEQAASLSGVSSASIYNWLSRGKEDSNNGEQTIYSEFLERVVESKAKAEALFLNTVRQAAQNGVWQAATWYLERSNPSWNKELQKQILEDQQLALQEEEVIVVEYSK
jgi:transposase